MHSDADARPRFEYYPINSPALRTVYVESSPFTIGRGEGVELQINCTSVSREHAQLTETASGYTLCDLGSTNGTSVNGQPTTKVDLRDGDAVSIADFELTFACSSMGRLQRMVTQPLGSNENAAPVHSLPPEVATHRALSEALLWQTFPLHWSSLSNRISGESFACLARLSGHFANQLRSLESSEPNAIGSRAQLMVWRTAAEEFASRHSDATLFLSVDHPASLQSGLLDSLEFAAESLPASQSLGVVLPWEWTTQSPTATKLCAELRSQGFHLIFDEFSGGAACVDALEQIRPDYLIIASHVLQGVATQPRRLQRLEIVQSGCEAAGVHLVLPSTTSPQDQQACGDMGVELAICDSSGTAKAAAEPLLVLH